METGMPFENLETITKANMPPMAKLSYMPPTVRVGKSPAKKARDPKPQLIVSIPTTICGTAKAKAFALLLGTGDDLGKLRIKGLKKDVGGGHRAEGTGTHLYLPVRLCAETWRRSFRRRTSSSVQDQRRRIRDRCAGQLVRGQGQSRA
jgi:hypothetical protein